MTVHYQGRYSVVGAQPCLEIVAKENKVITMDHEAGMRTEEMVEDPQVIPRRVAEGWKPQLTDELPDIFCGKTKLLIKYMFIHKKSFYGSV